MKANFEVWLDEIETDNPTEEELKELEGEYLRQINTWAYNGVSQWDFINREEA